MPQGLRYPPADTVVRQVHADTPSVLDPWYAPLRRLAKQIALPDVSSMVAPLGVLAGKLAGVPQRVYHGTTRLQSWYDDPVKVAKADAGQDLTPMEVAQQPLSQLKASTGGLKMMDGLGVHVGTPEAASQRLEQNWRQKFQQMAKPLAQGKAPGQLRGAHILPLEFTPEKPLTTRTGEPMTERALQSNLSRLAKRLGFPETRVYSRQYAGSAGLRNAQTAVKAELQRQGYDSIPYINAHEGRGSMSWVVLDPTKLRNRLTGQ